MITLDDLKAAIAECKGERNPNANTCFKLAAYYIIMREEYGDSFPDKQSYSFASAPVDSPEEEKVDYYSESEFGQAIQGKKTSAVLEVVDELITILQAVQPQMYNGVMRKLSEL